MPPRILFGLVLTLTGNLSWSWAQQPPRPSAATPVRRGYYSRLQTRPSPVTTERLRTDSDGPPRPYERPPVATPERTPPPQASYNYYPTLRSGQGPNRNVHCVPGRQALLHR